MSKNLLARDIAVRHGIGDERAIARWLRMKGYTAFTDLPPGYEKVLRRFITKWHLRREQNSIPRTVTRTSE